MANKVFPIQIRLSLELRKQLESEARLQNRSLNNLIIVVLTRYFSAKKNGAENAA